MGKKNQHKSTRKQTSAQISGQASRCAATKKRNNEIAVASRKKAKETARQTFFNPRTSRDNAADTITTPPSDDEGDKTDSSSGSDADDDANNVAVINNPVVRDIAAADVFENLDIDDEDEDIWNVDSNQSNNLASVSGIQQEWVKAIQARVQQEVSRNFQSIDSWLIQHLKNNDWWIRKHHASWITKKLGLKKEYDAYYRDVHVWLPDIRWHDPHNSMMPSCPHCLSNSAVAPHGFRDNHAGRVIVGIKETYYTISRRYICQRCKDEVNEKKAEMEAFAQDNEIQVTLDDNNMHYTFMGWNKSCLLLLPHGRGEKFPAFLTHRAGMDKTVVNMLRPLLNAGMRPDRISKLLLELHSKEFTDQCLSHEYEIKKQKEAQVNSLSANLKLHPLGDFS